MSEFERKSDRILDFLSLIPKNSKNLDEYKMKTIRGKLELIGSVNSNKISIIQCIITDNPKTEWHSHPETEHFILYDGYGYDIEYIENGVNYITKVDYDKSCYLKPNTPHRLINTYGDSKSVILIIPGSVLFPKGGHNGNW